MATLGQWKDEDVIQYVDLYYDNTMGPLNDNLLLPNTDTPIRAIELIDVRMNSAVPLSYLSIGFRNKHSGLGDIHGRSSAVVSVYNISTFDGSVYGNHYRYPTLIYKSTSAKKKDNSAEFRLQILSHPSGALLTPTNALVRLRITRAELGGVTYDEDKTRNVMMV